MDTSTQSLVNSILTSLVLGSGTSLIVKSLYDLADLNRKKQVEKSIEKSTHPVSIKVAAEDKSFSDTTLTAMKILGTLLAGGASYWGAQKLYDTFKHKNVKKDRDEAEYDYYRNLYLLKQLQDKRSKNDLEGFNRFASTDTNIKTAAGLGATIAGSLLALLALSAGASAFATRSYLADKYPTLNSDETYSSVKNTLPIKRVKFEKKDTEDKLKELIADEKTDNSLKVASEVYKILSPEINESLLKLAAYTEDADINSDVGINDVINAVACGYFDFIKSASSSDEIFDRSEFVMRKHAASDYKFPSDLNRQIAISYISSDPILADNVTPVAASVIRSKYATHAKLADVMDDSALNRMDASVLLSLCNISDRYKLAKTFVKDIDLNKLDFNIDSLDLRSKMESYLKS